MPPSSSRESPIMSCSITAAVSCAASPSVVRRRAVQVTRSAGSRSHLIAFTAAAIDLGQPLAGSIEADPAEGVGELRRRLRRGLRQHLLRRLRDLFPDLRLVEHAEAGRDVRLERDEVQEAFAEGVDGFDLQAARASRPRARKAGAPGGDDPATALTPSSSASSSPSDCLVERDPLRQPLEDADRHVGGRRLGEGQAEDPPGRRPGQQEPQHAVAQNLGLAGAGVRRHPGRGARIGGTALREPSEIVNDEELARERSGHGSPSSPSAFASDHSLTRAR